MGLDMYLYGIKSEYYKNDYNIGLEEESINIGYWRKANQIHNWFVQNIQGGVDNCARYHINENQLKELRKICKEVLNSRNEMNDNSKAEELLPTKEGFFFGSNEYDAWYYQDIRNTIEIIDWALEQEFDYFEYQSSW